MIQKFVYMLIATTLLVLRYKELAAGTGRRRHQRGAVHRSKDFFRLGERPY
jgi:DMSO/TMAO reductase YedYZ heme-binding membrane subunit